VSFLHFRYTYKYNGDTNIRRIPDISKTFFRYIFMVKDVTNIGKICDNSK